MGLWPRFRRGLRKAADNSIEAWFREFGSRTTASNVIVNQSTAMKVTAVMACVRVRSQDVAKLPPKICRLAKDGSKTEARDHFLYPIFRRPNAWQTWFEFCEMMQVALLLRGNAYAVVIRDGRGKPIALVPVNPDRVSLYEAPGGEVFYQVARLGLHETAVLREFGLMIPSDDLVHLRWAASANSLIGLSPITLAAEAVGLAMAQETHAATLAGNGARPSGILTTDKRLTKDVATRLKAQWDSIHGGTGKTGKTAVLEEGLKWQQLTLTSVDMEFIASRKLQVEEICRIFGVSPVKIGVLDAAVGRAFEQVQLAHYADSVHPDLVRWEQKLEMYFELGDELDVAFDETELLRADLAARANAARVLQVSGITTPNESRRGFGLNPYPGGDTLLVPQNVIPIEMAGKVGPGAPGPGSDQTGAPAPGGDGDPAQLPAG
jgi:HK97 family phage portal protein